VVYKHLSDNPNVPPKELFSLKDGRINTLYGTRDGKFLVADAFCYEGSKFVYKVIVEGVEPADGELKPISRKELIVASASNEPPYGRSLGEQMKLGDYSLTGLVDSDTRALVTHFSGLKTSTQVGIIHYYLRGLRGGELSLEKADLPDFPDIPNGLSEGYEGVESIPGATFIYPSGRGLFSKGGDIWARHAGWPSSATRPASMPFCTAPAGSRT
jgi:hypothetical protein